MPKRWLKSSFSYFVFASFFALIFFKVFYLAKSVFLDKSSFFCPLLADLVVSGFDAEDFFKVAGLISGRASKVFVA